MLSKSFNSKRVFKEKIVQLYIGIIKGEEPSSNNQNFWDEFFLLKANGNALEQELKRIENGANCKAVVNLLFHKCLVAIRDSNQIRITNGLMTLCSITHHALFTLKPNHESEEALDILFNRENVSNTVEEFIETLSLILLSEYYVGIKSIVLKLLLIFSVASSEIDHNILLEYFMSYQIFDALIHLLNNQLQDGYRVLLLLVIFLNFKKPHTNPYVMQMSIVDNEAILSGFSQVIANELIEFNNKFERLCAESKSGLLSSLSRIVIFSGDSDNTVGIAGIMSKKSSFKTLNTVLLAFYEAVSLNRNFISLLTTTPSEMYMLNKTDESSGVESTYSVPPNLLVAFLEFSSIVMLGMKDETTTQTARLCLIIMTCITEDSSANSIIHDNNMAFIVNLHRMPMRHRKIATERSQGIRPISYAVLDLMVEFILAHLNRNMQYDLFHLCLGILHRLICFQKRCRVRIGYNWKELWSTLILLIKFLLNNESYFLKRQFNLFQMSLQVINLFNLFITCGDNFLASDVSYDELYYEIIRMHTVFDNLNSLALRHMTKEGNDFKDAAGRLTNSMINIKAIIAHFNSKIEAYSSANQIVTLSEEQVLEVFRANYDSLTLKVQDNIEQFEPYNFSTQNELDFFAKILASIIEDYVTNKPLTVSFEEQHALMQEIQTVSSFGLGSEKSAPAE